MDKFLDEISTDEWEVETPTGWQSFSGISKTIEFEEYEIKTQKGKTLICADDHLVIKSNGEQVFVKDLSPSDCIITDESFDEVLTVTKTGSSSSMYDLQNVLGGNVYFTNGILSHNTTSVVAYLLWYTLFNADKVVAILANKGNTAKEILARYMLALENIPFFLQPGCKVLNKNKVLFSNNTKIIAAATSSSSIRGESCSLLALDEFAFVNDAETFYTSTYPVISAGSSSKVIITSTPNGVGNMFHSLWTGAVTKTNLYHPFRIYWHDVPGRDEKWKAETIANTSQRQFEQEYECVAADSIITVRDIFSNEVIDIEIQELYAVPFQFKKFELLTPDGWSSFRGISKTQKNVFAEITFEDGMILECSLSHEILVKGSGFTYAIDLIEGTTVVAKNNTFLRVTRIKIIHSSKDFYDCLDVGLDHCYYTNGIVSHNCSFLGSGRTLIDGNKLMGFSAQNPIRTNLEGTVSIYEDPKENHSYVMTVDVARGRGQDHSAFSIIDVTESPMKQVAAFYDNMISPLLFPVVLNKYGKQYNDAFIIVETNDNGSMVVNSLFQDLEYENLYNEVRSGRTMFGVETTKRVKMLGCSTLKDLVEENRLLIYDKNTIQELCSFVSKGNSYEAETGNHDDLVMTLVLFSWFTSVSLFQSLTNINIRNELFEQEMKNLEDELSPIGILGDTGIDEVEAPILEEFGGQLWEEMKW